MSTRGMVGVVVDGQLKGCYNHFDSYPEGLGVQMVSFVEKLAEDIELLEKFRDNIRKIEWIQDDSECPSAEQIEKIRNAGFDLVTEIKTKRTDDSGYQYDEITPLPWYEVIRDYQGVGYFELVLQGFPYLLDGSDFIDYSLFCEYAYVLNLDTLKLEFYEGFVYVYGHVTGLRSFRPWYRDSEGRRYTYGKCKKVGEKNIYDLDGWIKFYHVEIEDE